MCSVKHVITQQKTTLSTVFQVNILNKYSPQTVIFLKSNISNFFWRTGEWELYPLNMHIFEVFDIFVYEGSK